MPPTVFIFYLLIVQSISNVCLPVCSPACQLLLMYTLCVIYSIVIACMHIFTQYTPSYVSSSYFVDMPSSSPSMPPYAPSPTSISSAIDVMYDGHKSWRLMNGRIYAQTHTHAAIITTFTRSTILNRHKHTCWSDCFGLRAHLKWLRGRITQSVRNPKCWLYWHCFCQLGSYECRLCCLFLHARCASCLPVHQGSWNMCWCV